MRLTPFIARRTGSWLRRSTRSNRDPDIGREIELGVPAA
jgi:hypothetical protein